MKEKTTNSRDQRQSVPTHTSPTSYPTEQRNVVKYTGTRLRSRYGHGLPRSSSTPTPGREPLEYQGDSSVLKGPLSHSSDPGFPVRDSRCPPSRSSPRTSETTTPSRRTSPDPVTYWLRRGVDPPAGPTRPEGRHETSDTETLLGPRGGLGARVDVGAGALVRGLLRPLHPGRPVAAGVLPSSRLSSGSLPYTWTCWFLQGPE